MEIKSLNLQELKTWCEELALSFNSKQILLLNGPLGAGKTELVKQLLLSLGSDEAASPTYGLIHNYETQKIKSVVHTDLYRLEGDEDLESTGFWDLFNNDSALIIVEWAERVPMADWPLGWSKMVIDISLDSNSAKRSYEISNQN